MNIPEKLSRLSEKELKETLKDNIYTATYIIDKEYNRILELETKVGKFFYPKDNRNRIRIADLKRSSYYAPLTYEALQRFKVANILSKVNEWDYTTFFKWCTKQFINAYGEEFVDVQGEYILVHFPEVVISNTLEQSHLLRDVYLKFRIAGNYITLYGLMRGTLTNSEIRNDYEFSHIDGNGAFKWSSSFCFGYTSIADLRSDLNTRDKIFRKLPFFLEAIKEYLSWESLEGIPYRKIDNVIYDKRLWEQKYNYNYSTNDALQVVLDNINGFTYTYNYDEGELTIELSSSSEEEIGNILAVHYPEQIFPSLNGNSVQRNTTTFEEYANNGYILFKNEKRPFKVINTDAQDVELPMKINSIMLRDVINTLEQKFRIFIKTKKLNGIKN